MKATELQIGDLVWLSDDICVKVEQITTKKIGYHAKANECKMHYARLCDIEPIPITSEILEANGFGKWKHISGCNEWLYCGFGKEDSNGEFDSVSLREARSNNNHHWCMELSVYGEGSGRLFIDYIHELQHALKLCKIDKEIKLC